MSTTYEKTQWYNSVKDAKKLWTLIDWQGKVEVDNPELSYHEIYKFFKNVFQSHKLMNDPVLQKDSEEMEEYHKTVLITDKNISIEEVNDYFDKLGTGSGLDGLSPAISKLFPQALKQVILKLFENIFNDDYPEDWYNQLLFPLTKNGHTRNEPKL